MPGGNTLPYKRLQRLLCCQCSYTARATKQRTGLYKGIPIYLPCFAAVWLCAKLCCVACATLERITVPQRLHRYQIPPPHQTLCSSSQPPYYNKVYNGAAVRLLRGQRLHLYRVSPAASRCFPRPAEQSSGGSAAGGAEPLTATAVSLFGLSPDS